MSESHDSPSSSGGTSAMIVLGGICAGSGIMTLLFGFEPQGGADFAEQISTVGFNGLPYITLTSAGYVAFGLIALGLALAIAGNSGAWKRTGGY